MNRPLPPNSATLLALCLLLAEAVACAGRWGGW